MKILLELLILLLATCFTKVLTNDLEIAQLPCEDRLNECESNLDPVYQQPEELRRRWQNCRVSLLEEKQQSRQQRERTVAEVATKPAETTPTPATTLPIGVEGRWEQLTMDNSQPIPPPGAVKNLNEGSLIAWPDYVARTWIGDDTVPCRVLIHNNRQVGVCWTSWERNILGPKSFELLIGDYAWKWTNSSTPIPSNALIGGYRTIQGNKNREILYVGRAIHDQFQYHDIKPNQLLLGHIYGSTRELEHVAWEIQRKTTYQILVKI